MRPPNWGGLLDGRRDLRELGSHGRPGGGHGDDGNDRDQRDEERVLEQVLAFVVASADRGEEIRDECHVHPSARRSAARDVGCRLPPDAGGVWPHRNGCAAGPRRRWSAVITRAAAAV